MHRYIARANVDNYIQLLIGTGHVEERSYGSFYRSMSLPFEPENGAVDAHFDNGVLRLTIKKPAKAIKTTKTIDIRTGTAPRKAA